MDDGHDRSGPDPTAGNLPFDSMASLRALGDIQRRGLEAANLVIGRLLAQVEQGGPLFGAEPPRSADGEPAAGGANGSDLIGQYSSFVSSYLAALLGGPPSSGTAAAAGGSRTGVTTGVGADPLALPPTVAGTAAEGELWLHNRSGTAVSDVRVHCGDLRRHDGWAIAASAVGFEPDHLDELPDLTSRGIRVTVDVPAETPVGTYRGTLLATNLPQLWLDVALEVVADP